MSAYDIQAFNPDHRVRVGWDGPLETFFVQVHDWAGIAPEDETTDPKQVLWRGALETDKITSPEQVMAICAPYAQVPPDVLARLALDRAASRPPSAMQQAMRAFFLEGDERAERNRSQRLHREPLTEEARSRREDEERAVMRKPDNPGEKIDGFDI